MIAGGGRGGGATTCSRPDAADPAGCTTGTSATSCRSSSLHCEVDRCSPRHLVSSGHASSTCQCRKSAVETKPHPKGQRNSPASARLSAVSSP
jgi:hypothetical protein